MGELTLTVMRLGLLVMLWVFVFAIVGVLRGDLYGTRVKRRAAGPAKAAARGAVAAPPRTATPDRKASRSRKGPSKLLVTGGPLAGTTLPLRPSGTLIGRSPECALVLDDDYVSGRHARIFQGDDGTWQVEDLRSTNGTFLGATRLTEPREVAVGSVLRIGQTVVELQR
ncbi:MAG TPA: FHA domain-containing protein [Ornithinibacter sp.]|nr:FHA domain-containing protein [Ornithinibacter sp.]